MAYGAGQRVAEVAALKVTDVDSERMLLRVERGKGGRYDLPRDSKVVRSATRRMAGLAGFGMGVAQP